MVSLDVSRQVHLKPPLRKIQDEICSLLNTFLPMPKNFSRKWAEHAAPEIMIGGEDPTIEEMPRPQLLLHGCCETFELTTATI
jgi:hypothetical protein